MAKRKKSATLRKRKSATRRTTRTAPTPRRGKAAKRTVAKRMPKKVKATLKRAMKKAARKKAGPIKPRSAPEVETVIVDVVEEPVPGVITVTEFEETEIREPRVSPERPEED